MQNQHLKTGVLSTWRGNLRAALFLLVGFWGISAQAMVLEISQAPERVEINPFLELLEDHSGLLSLFQVAGTQSNRFTPVHSSLISTGLKSSVYWFRFSYHNMSNHNLHNLLVVNTYSSARIESFDPNIGVLPQFTTGASVNYSARPVVGSRHAVPVVLKPGEHQLYLRISSPDPMNLTFVLESEQQFDLTNHRLDMAVSLMVSLMIMVAVAAGIMAAVYRNPLFVATSAYALSLAFFHGGWSGIFSPLMDFAYIDTRIRNGFGLMATVAIMGLIFYVQQTQWQNWVQKAWLAGMGVTGAFALYCFSLASIPQSNLALVIVALLNIGFNAALIGRIGLPQLLVRAGIGVNLMLLALLAAASVGLVNTVEFTFWSIKFLSLISMGLVMAGVVLIQSQQERPATQDTYSIGKSSTQWKILQKLNHDLRTPINGVLGMSELLGETTLSANQLDYLNTIQNAGHDLLKTADEIKALSRILSNRLSLDRQHIDLTDFLHDITLPYARAASQKNVELITDIGHTVPNHVEGDPILLAHTLNCLLDNAVKHTDKGEILVQVSSSTESEIRFRVTDTGNGIANHRLTRLFDFDQEKDSKTVFIGLPIAYRIVAAMGGQLGVSSEARLGTTFWFNLRMPEIPVEKNTVPAEESLYGLKMLIVDDNLTCRKVMEHQASTWGIRVDTVPGGQEALAQLHTQYHLHTGYDVVVLDHQMPKMDGTQLAQRIHQDKLIKKDIVLIMMTGLDLREGDKEIQDAGVDFLLTKPVSSRQFQQVLYRALPAINPEKDRVSNGVSN